MMWTSRIEDGGYTDVVLEQGTTQQAPYVQLRVGDGELVCVAYVSVTFSDGQQRAWDGTWAQQSGLYWYYSGILVSKSDSDTGMCIWMDEFVGTIFIYMPAFTGVGEDPNPAVASYTGERGFRAYVYNDAVEEIQIPRDFPDKKKKKKRAAARAVRKTDSRLVITDRPGHSAVELCESETSHGPSLVPLVEGMFCNMETRELQPLCVAGELTEGCFDIEKAKGTSGQRVRSASGSVEGTGFASVIDWTSH